jgi:hypothetical protein
VRRARHLLIGAAVAVSTIGVADAAPVDAAGSFRATGAVLKGANEVPDPGDPDGFGASGVIINAQRGTICYFVAVAKIGTATLAHIHEGGPDIAGPVVVDFKAPSRGFSADCVDVDPALAQRIADNPSGFYVNVHNDEFPRGAVRGQLH